MFSCATEIKTPIRASRGLTKSSVHCAPMTDVVNDNDSLRHIQFINDAIIPNAHAILVFGGLEFAMMRREGVLYERVNGVGDSGDRLRVDIP
jgi:hypothetical protein